jgi:hypothetical protein
MEVSAYRIRSGGNSPMSTFLFLTPWSALDALHTELVMNGRAWAPRAARGVNRDAQDVELVASV